MIKKHDDISSLIKIQQNLNKVNEKIQKKNENINNTLYTFNSIHKESTQYFDIIINNLCDAKYKIADK